MARHWTRAAAGAALCVAVAASPALGDIGGRVTTLAGAPLDGATVTLTDAAAAQVGTATADATGAYSFATTLLAGKTAPFTLRATASDPCRIAPEATVRSASATGAADASTQNLSVDVTELCAAAFDPLRPASAFVDSASRRVLAGPGSIAYLRTPIPALATGVEVRMSNGTVISQPPAIAGVVPIIAPTTPYSGPLTLAYSINGSPVTRTLGDMTSGVVTPPPPKRPLDVVAAIPLAGVATLPDGVGAAADWVGLSAQLTRPADQLAAFGFDTGVKPVFDLGPVTGPVGKQLVEDIAAATLSLTTAINSPDQAFSQARRMLTVPGANQSRRRLVIYVSTLDTTSAPSANAHLQLAFNGTSSPWPVCAIGVGRRLAPAEATRLRRIALDTGGTFIQAPFSRDVPDRMLACRAAGAGDTTMAQWSATLTKRVKQTRMTVPAGRALTVLVSQDPLSTRPAMTLVDPAGKSHSSAKPGSGVTFVLRPSYTLVTVAKAAKGTWAVRLNARRGATVDLRVVSSPASAGV